MGRKPTHGRYAKDDVEKTPLRVKRLMNEIFQVLNEEGVTNERLDRYIVEILARNLDRARQIDNFLVDNLFTKNNEPQPILRVYWQALNAAARACAQLGLTPNARMRLGSILGRAQGLASRSGELKSEETDLDVAMD